MRDSTHPANGEFHEVADKVLAAMRTVPRKDKMSESAGNWIPLEKLEAHIQEHRKQTRFFIDTETFLLAIGLLVGRSDIECNRAHGRDVGYFFSVRPTQEHLPL